MSDSESVEPNEQEYPARPSGRDEMNLAEFPFASLTRQGNDQDAFTYEGWITDKAGKRLRQRWTVRGAGGLGLPTEYDERVVIALMAISADQGFETRKIPFSVYQILQIMGTSRSKRAYESVERSLERLVGVTIYAEGAFWDNGEKSWVKVKSGFHLIDKYWLAYLEEDETVREAEGVPGYFIWSEDIWKSVQDGYIKYLDLNLYFSLNSPIARRLYRFLDKRMAYQNEYEIDIFDLSGRLGMARYKYPSKVLEKLQPALDELIAQRFLSDARPVKVGRYTRMRFEQKAALGPVGEGAKALAASEVEAAPEIMAPLMALGLSERVARELTAQHDRAHILEKIDFLLWEQESNPSSIRNPQGWLRRAIEEDWGAPEGYRSPLEQANDQAQQEALLLASDNVPPPQRDILRERYGTTEREREQWQSVLFELQGRLTRATFQLLFPHTMLLQVEKGVARIGVPNEMVEQWLAYRLRLVLAQALAQYVQPDLEPVFVILKPDEWGDT